MNDPETTKILGIIGGILSLLLPFNYFIGLIGIIILLICYYMISKKYNENVIFNYYLYSFVLLLLSVTIGYIVIIFFLTSIITTTSINNINPMTVVNLLNITTIISFIAIWICFVLATYFIKKSLTKVSQVTQIKNFEKAGNFQFYSSILLPTFIGFIILFILGKIFEILAFVDIKE